MKEINNIDTLIERLALIDKDWQRIIYDKTGVILSERLNLVSNCGSVDLVYEDLYYDEDNEDNDEIEYCEINSIDEAISYIEAMKSSVDRLQDVSYGKFTKSELFWAILERILLRPENLNEDGVQPWALFSIGKDEQHVEVWIWDVFNGYNAIWLDITEKTTLDDALMMLVSELNPNAEDQDWAPYLKIFDVEYSVPNTYEELKTAFSKGSVFECYYP